jgi:amino acid adenylation domain-containing protein
MGTELGSGAESLEKRIGELSPEKRELMERLLREKKGAGSRQSVIPRRKVSNTVPLSFGQQRIWMLDRLMPGSAFYNETTTLRLSFRLNVPALERSINEIVRRHEVLRTTFLAVDGQPVQVIAPTLSLPLPVVDLRELQELERESEARRMAREEAGRPFSLGRGPLVRTTLLRMGEEDYVLLLTMHHIVYDGWSLGVFVWELTTLYSAFSMGQPSPLPDLPIQYADFAVWQQKRLRGEVLETQLAYWKKQLANLPVLQLATDRPRPPVQSFQGARQMIKISEPLYAALKALSQREGVTQFMTLLAAFQTLLYRYTGQDDIAVGVPIANRNRAAIEGLIGFFVNTLVMRTDLSGNPSFRELLGRVREVALGAYAREELPFEKLVEEFQPERDLSHNPLFQVAFQLVSGPGSTWGYPEQLPPVRSVEIGATKFDLRFDLLETLQGLDGYLDYSTDLFDATTITRMVGHFQVLLEGIVADPEQRISELPLLTEAERHQLLVEWNETTAAYPKDMCIHNLFEAQVEQRREAIALLFEDNQLTYGKLNRRANQLAHHLQTLGVGPETLVGICIERCVEMVVALLGILKAGGACVPLDPTYPKERLAFMLADAKLLVLLTQEPLLERITEHGAKIVCLDTDWEAIAREREENPASGAGADNLAYMIYTSGSTGRPKGVLVAHRGLCNVAEVELRTFHVRPDSRILQFASLSFDASIFEIAMALRAGATLCLARQESLLPGQDLIRLLREQAVSIVLLPPSALAALPTEPLPALQTITVTGEACSADLVARWAPGRRFFNLYGPTESTLFITVAECSNDNQRPSIGRAIANIQVYVLDRQLQLVPIGVPGELHIGGVGLARGYLNHPELTAQKFIPHPFSDEPGARLYKTGDLVRYLPNGNLEFLGRIDHQVKLRGFRIELGEVEAVLAQHPAVRETVVVVREDTLSEKRLVAYLIPHGKSVPSVSELRRFLQGKLPSYMIPSAFVWLDAFPLLPNGKLDRWTLPAPDTARPELEGTYVAPRNQVEQTIRAIWQEVLHLEKVGVHDNFFDLGGHSLLIVRLHSKLREVLNAQLSIIDLFHYPTISSLSEYLSQEQCKPHSFANPGSS